MGRITVEVEGVSKQYRIYDQPRDRLKETLSRGRVKRHREFWALRDISFALEEGSTTGIIGPNGCGKSTLLQILAGTLEPTSGRVAHHGRIAALLELGAGFNPEFTGIENAFMNTALMGLTRAETVALLPQIERFAEIGDFIHQPVKQYSSGMYVRLAFAIAISVNPQILIIDEALAVGDAIFQHRCMQRLREIQESGATILFVSHDPGAIRALCSRAILLNAGKVLADGKPREVLSRYQKLIMMREEAYEASQAPSQNDASVVSSSAPSQIPSTYRHGDRSAEIISVELLDATRRPVEIVESGEQVLVRVRAKFHNPTQSPVCGLLIRNRYGIHVYGTNTQLNYVDFGEVQGGEVIETTFAFDCWLAPEIFSITVAVHSIDNISYDWVDGALFFRVISTAQIEGIANLNAQLSTRRFAAAAGHQEVDEQQVSFA